MIELTKDIIGWVLFLGTLYLAWTFGGPIGLIVAFLVLWTIAQT